MCVCVSERERERDSGGPGLHFRGVDVQTQLDQMSICDAFFFWGGFSFFPLEVQELQINQPLYQTVAATVAAATAVTAAAPHIYI